MELGCGGHRGAAVRVIYWIQLIWGSYTIPSHCCERLITGVTAVSLNLNLPGARCFNSGVIVQMSELAVMIAMCCIP